jgi:hypothetical protein
MPELVRILTDDHGAITHLVAEDEERLSVAELAQKLSDGEDYYITFGEEQRYPITIVAEEGHLDATIDDPDGEHTIWDLPQEDDPAESEITEIFDDMSDMGEFKDEGLGNTEQSEDTM